MDTVYCLLCIGTDDDETLRIFSTPERRQAWADTDQRIHVFYEYLLDDPDHWEKPITQQ